MPSSRSRPISGRHGGNELNTAALWAYYFCVWDDGVQSGNLACTYVGDWGCWKHRENVFVDTGSTTLSMGTAVAPDNNGNRAYTFLTVDAGSPLPYEYTWQQALADGASASG